MPENYAVEVDTHVHTVLSGHCWSTFGECMTQARDVGLKGVCITEHSSAAPNGPPEWATVPMQNLPETYLGVRVFRGLEADILDTDGRLSNRDEYLSVLHFCIASIHVFSSQMETEAQRTQAFIGALENDYVDMLGHIEKPSNACDLPSVVLAVKKKNRLVELNNSSFLAFRKGSMERSFELLTLCKRHDVRICVDSDAHVHTMVGDFTNAAALLQEVDFPPELIVNRTLESFLQYLQQNPKKRLSTGVT